MSHDLTIEQPMPTHNAAGSIQSLVRADLETRERIGVKRYGTPLQPHNGRDALRDAYEEALDLACYLRQAIEERASNVPQQGCEVETHSWSHFTHDQADSYWIRCTLSGPHDEHKDEHTGLTWTGGA